MIRKSLYRNSTSANQALLPSNGKTPKEWRSWYDQNKSRLFFTQAGGFVFMVNTRDPKVAGNSYAKVMPGAAAVAEPAARNAPEPASTDDLNPVTFAAGVIKSQDGKELAVTFKVHPGYHMYSHVAPEDAFVATQVKIELPAGYSAVGALSKPPFEPFNEAGTTGMITRSGKFTQRISGSGPGTAKVRITYQTCDDHICFPPATLELNVPLG